MCDIERLNKEIVTNNDKVLVLVTKVINKQCVAGSKDIPSRGDVGKLLAVMGTLVVWLRTVFYYTDNTNFKNSSHLNITIII